MKVHISNFYGTRNKGDELMLRGLIGELLNIHDCNFTVSTFYNPTLDSLEFDDDIKFVKSIGSAEDSLIRRIITAISFILMIVNLSKIAKQLLSCTIPEYKKTFENIEQSNILITTGGPFFNENILSFYGLKMPTFNYVASFIELLYASKRKIPYYIVGQSFGHIKFGISRFFFRIILNKAEKIAGRESRSVKLLRHSIKFKKEILILPDLAMSRRLHEIFLSNVSRQNKILINVREMSDSDLKYLLEGHNIDPGTSLRTLYEDIIVNYIKTEKRLNPLVRFVFICQAIDNDEIISKRIIKKTQLESTNFALISDTTAQSFVNIFSECKLAIVTRYHSMIISILTKTPFIALGYSPKVTSALNDYNLAQFCLSGRNFNLENISLLKNQILNSNLDINLPDFQDKLSQFFSTTLKHDELQ